MRIYGIKALAFHMLICKEEKTLHTKTFFFIIFASIFSFLFNYRFFPLSNIEFLRIYWHINTNEKVVSLTFDDGPELYSTPKILNILMENNIKATFFNIGKKMRLYPQMVERQIKEGHIIANHTYNHLNLYRENEKTVCEEFRKTKKIIEQITGKQNYLFRPPKGVVDFTIFRIARKFNSKIILWGVCVENHRVKTPQQMADRVLSKTRPGTIILAHLGGTYKTKTIAAVEIIIKELRKRGYKFVTLSSLDKAGLNN